MAPPGVVEAVDVLDEIAVDVVHVVPARVALELEEQGRKALDDGVVSAVAVRLMLPVMP